ncbi:MAG: hypothetical protein M1363_06460 [Gammaproteobacteria bacterium]|nr:hypothetical protein [Gammaproteobacteria bacterium]
MDYETTAADSAFLNFVAQEFSQPGTNYRRLLSDPRLAPFIVKDWGLAPIENSLDRAPVPQLTTEYRFYTFQGVIAFFLSIDHNQSPPRLAFFDGSLAPLQAGQDVVLNDGYVQSGPHCLARDLLCHIWWARELSMRCDAPFVQVKLYDTDDGLKFAGLSFAPSDMHEWFSFHNGLLEKLDALFIDAELRLAAGMKSPPAELAEFSLQQLMWSWRLSDVKQIPLIEERIFKGFADIVLHHDDVGYDRIAKHYLKLKKQASAESETQALTALTRAWRLLYSIYHTQTENDNGS